MLSNSFPSSPLSTVTYFNPLFPRIFISCFFLFTLISTPQKSRKCYVFLKNDNSAKMDGWFDNNWTRKTHIIFWPLLRPKVILLDLFKSPTHVLPYKFNFLSLVSSPTPFHSPSRFTYILQCFFYIFPPHLLTFSPTISPSVSQVTKLWL